MTSNFPVSLDALTNPGPTTPTTDATTPHASQHANINDIIEAIEAKLGIGSGGPPASNALLRQTASGQSNWGLLVNGDVDPVAGIALSKMAHVGSGNVLKSNGTTNVGGKIVAADVTVGALPALIAADVKASAGATFQFSSIPSGYRHLELRINGRSSWAATADVAYLQVNGDTGTNYYGISLIGLGATTLVQEEAASTTRANVGLVPAATAGHVSWFGASTIQVHNYLSTVAFKSLLIQNHYNSDIPNGNQHIRLHGMIWAQAVAITSLTIGLTSASNWVAGSVASLYGYP